jgi:hypothetical protein
MSVTLLGPIPGVPDDLIRQLNSRFRELEVAIVPAAASSGSTRTINTTNVTVVSEGSVAGLFFLAANRPDANGTPVGTFGTEIDTGALLQVQTVGSAQVWVQVSPWLDDGETITATEPVALDVGDAPDDSQIQVRADGLGGLELLCYGADNVRVGFDMIRVGGVNVATHTSACMLLKNGDQLTVYGATGQTVGNAVALNLLFTIDLATGNVDAVTGVYKKGGTQVVGAQGAAVTPASGAGAAGVDTPARNAINAVISRLQAHGLIA